MAGRCGMDKRNGRQAIIRERANVIRQIGTGAVIFRFGLFAFWIKIKHNKLDVPLQIIADIVNALANLGDGPFGNRVGYRHE